MPPRDPTSLRILLTGASTGLGLAIAQRLLRETNHRLLLTARERSMDRFSAAGIYELEMTATDTEHTSSVKIKVTVSPADEKK